LDPVARVAMSLRASLYGIPASTKCRLTMNLATNQRAQRRDRTNVCMCHLDHLLPLPRAHRRRVPPTEAARLKSTLYLDCGASKDFKARGLAIRSDNHVILSNISQLMRFRPSAGLLL